MLYFGGSFSDAAVAGTVVLTARRGKFVPPDMRGDDIGDAFCDSRKE